MGSHKRVLFESAHQRGVRIALENAASVAGVLLLTEATLTEVEEPKPEQPHAPAFDAEM